MRPEPHFRLSATRSASQEGTKTAVALPHSRECIKEPISALSNYGSDGKLGARAESRNILQEKLRGRGGSSCPFDRKIGKKRAAAKNTYTLSVWGQQQVNAKIKQKTHATSPAIDLKHIVPFLPDKAQVHPSCLLCFTFNCFLLFSGQSAILHSSTLHAPYTNADVRGDPLHSPHPIPCPTSNTRICLLRDGRAKLLHRRIDRACLDFGWSRRTTVCGHGAYCIGVRMPYLRISASRRRCVGRYVCFCSRTAWCRTWRVVGVSPSVGVRTGGIGWN